MLPSPILSKPGIFKNILLTFFYFLFVLTRLEAGVRVFRLAPGAAHISRDGVNFSKYGNRPISGSLCTVLENYGMKK